jgi:hypothetical protein
MVCVSSFAIEANSHTYLMASNVADGHPSYAVVDFKGGETGEIPLGK